ncbi:MAG: hydrogenase maturation protease [Nocardioidaceae bacterium]
MAANVLVAGIGNIFLGDDGFGPEVAQRMLADGWHGGALPDGVRVVDYGIRGMHLAYDLLDGVDALVLVDALPGNGPPGSLSVLEVSPEDVGNEEFDAHGMAPVAVLASLTLLGGELPATYVVGCCPVNLDEGIGLSPPVASAVDGAMSMVRTLVADRLVAAVSAGGSD